MLCEAYGEILVETARRGRWQVMLEITEHTKVFTAHDEYVGKVDRIVIDPLTRKVSHIVVHKGVLLPEDKVIAVGRIATATEERINLARGSHPDEMPAFVEQHYVELDEADQDPEGQSGAATAPFVWYGPYGMVSTMYESSMRLVTKRNIPERAVALESDISVCALGRDEIGRFDEVITTDAGLATHIIVTMSDSTLDRKAIPMHWVDNITENEIMLGVTSWMVDAIETYDPRLSPTRS